MPDIPEGSGVSRRWTLRVGRGVVLGVESSELSSDEAAHGVEAAIAEVVVVAELEVEEGSSDDVRRGDEPMESDEASESATEPAEAESLAAAEQGAGAGDPLGGESVEGVAEPGGGVVEPALLLGVVVGRFGLGGGLLPCIVLEAGAFAAMLGEGGSDESAEVAREGADVVAVEMGTETSLCIAEDHDWILAEEADELGDRDVELVEGVDVLKEHASAGLIGPSCITRRRRSAYEHLLVCGAARGHGRTSCAGTSLIGTQQCGDYDRGGCQC